MSEVFRYLSSTTVLGLSLENLTLAFLAILAGLLVRKLLSAVVLRYIAHLTRRTHTDLDDMILEAVRKPLEVGVVLIFIALALTVLQVPPDQAKAERILHALLSLATTVVVTWLLFRVVDAFAKYLGNLASQTDSKVDDALIPLGQKAIKIFLFLLAFLVALQNIGYSVTGLVAGLGIGGLALALAAQDTVANLFGSVMILLDRPFRVGDWIKGTDFEGTVEEVGFRSTRVRTFPRTLVTVPNKQMADMVIDNQQAMPARRIQIVVGVTYATTPAQMRQALEGIRAIIERLPGMWAEGTLVRFNEFGASSLNILVRCFTTNIGMDEHSRVREELHFAIMDLFESLGIEFAFPSQTIYYGGGEPLAVLPRPGAPPPGPPDVLLAGDARSSMTAPQATHADARREPKESPRDRV